jgi:hypothetical protein
MNVTEFLDKIPLWGIVIVSLMITFLSTISPCRSGIGQGAFYPIEEQRHDTGLSLFTLYLPHIFDYKRWVLKVSLIPMILGSFVQGVQLQ